MLQRSGYLGSVSALFAVISFIAFAVLTGPFVQATRSSTVTPKNVQTNAEELDLLILHGKLVDGSGKRPRMADVGIRGDRIAFVGDATKAKTSEYSPF